MVEGSLDVDPDFDHLVDSLEGGEDILHSHQGAEGIHRIPQGDEEVPVLCNLGVLDNPSLDKDVLQDQEDLQVLPVVLRHLHNCLETFDFCLEGGNLGWELGLLRQHSWGLHMRSLEEEVPVEDIRGLGGPLEGNDVHNLDSRGCQGTAQEVPQGPHSLVHH